MGAPGIRKGEAWDTTRCPTMPRTVPSTKNYLAQNVNGADTLVLSKQHPVHADDQ